MPAYGARKSREMADDGEAMPAKATGKGETKSEEGMSSTELLNVLRAQKAQSLGFSNDKTLNDERARALDYYKGQHAGAMMKDLPVQENRSSVVIPYVANSVEIALPDLLEVFTGDDDVLTFMATNHDDEEGAKQETDYVRHVLFQQNPGWRLMYDAFKDALISKLGVWHFYWNGQPEYQEEETIATEAQVEEMLEQGVELVGIEPTNTFALYNGQSIPLVKATLRRTVSEGHACVEVVAPEDFTVGPDTVRLCDANYCAMRATVTVQSLLDAGYDEDKARSLTLDESEDSEHQARDTAEESDESDDAGHDDLKMVEVVTHYIRLDVNGEGRTQIWRVVTGNDEAVELEREKRARIEFAAITPYPMPHRFYGQSLADKAMPIQAWKTSITRGANDHIYYTNNQRQEVKETGLIAGVTLEQLVDNQPGRPVVTKDGNSLRPIANGAMGFDPMGYLEHIEVEGEMSTGMMRNAQGLKPDTLHDTKGGAEILIGAAQKRTRLMARMFAETGVRDLFIGLHDLLRSNATMKDTIRLRNKWVEIDPSSWARRKDVVVDIGVGSGGRDRDLIAFREYRSLLEAIGNTEYAKGIITPENVYAFADAYGTKLSIKGAERFITDPANAPPQEEAAPEGPTPEQMALQAKTDMMMAEAKARIEIKQFEAAEEAKLARDKMQLDHELALERIALEHKLAVQTKTLEAELAMAGVANGAGEPFHPGGDLAR